MNIKIYSREEMEKLLSKGIPDNTAIISFYNPKSQRVSKDYPPIDYSGKCNHVFQICLYDIDIEILKDYGLTYDTYLPEADDLAKFIYEAKQNGFDIICQCEYGQSRSAACAAAIAEHFYKTGIWIFADYRYYPNPLVFHKIFDALEKQSPDRKGVKNTAMRNRQCRRTTAKQKKIRIQKLYQYIGYYFPYVESEKRRSDNGKLIHRYIHYKKSSSNKEQFFKKYSNRVVRKKDVPRRGNGYRKCFDYWWTID